MVPCTKVRVIKIPSIGSGCVSIYISIYIYAYVYVCRVRSAGYSKSTTKQNKICDTARNVTLLNSRSFEYKPFFRSEPEKTET